MSVIMSKTSNTVSCFLNYGISRLTGASRLYSSVSNVSNIVKIVEVGPRDGLQNESKLVSSEIKLELIDKLGIAGLSTIEATSFVSPKWVPQMADNAVIMKNLKKRPGVSYPVLVPNLKGLSAAVDACVEEIAVFCAASEAFSQKNTNCSISDSLDRMKEVTSAAIQKGIKVRGYVSCIVGCPYQGPINPNQVLPVVEALLAAGCYEVSLGDTIGVGTPGTMRKLLKHLTTKVAAERLAIHCHDTYGQALVNVLTALEFGIRTVDSSVAGLGGCPYATGASGNVATEDVVFMLHGMGIPTGIDLKSVIKTGQWVCDALNRENGSKVGRAFKDGNLFIK